MSELSESVQIWHASTQDIVEAATHGGVAGVVIESGGAWLCFVPFAADDIDRAAAFSRGLALTWRYAADYGLWVTFFEKGAVVGCAHFETDGGCALDFDLRECLGRHGVSPALANELEAVKHELPSSALPDGVARRLGLTLYSWLSPEYLQDSLDKMREEFPNLVEVQA